MALSMRLIWPVGFLRAAFQNVDYLFDDITAVRTKLLAAGVDLGVLRTPIVALITDITAVRTQVAAAVADIAALRAAIVGLTAKLDADGGVTDTNYAATLDPAAQTSATPAALTAAAPAALTYSAPASLTSQAITFTSG